MLVGLYLFAPFIRKIVSSTSKRELGFLCIMLFLFSMLVDAANFFHFDIYIPVFIGPLFITWFLSYLGYFLAGYLLGRIIDIKIRLFSLIDLLIASISLTAVGCYLLTARYSFDLGQFFISYFNPTIVVMSISVFLIAKKLLT
jgi:surface polysaccharide O-acyltransferase-like enzyme